MNNKELHNPEEDQHIFESDWLFCPICGNKLPNVQNLKFCIKCGVNLKYIKENKKLPSTTTLNPYKTTSQYPLIQRSLEVFQPPKITDEQLTDPKKHKLWSSLTSIGLPLGAFLFMNFILGGFFALLTFASFDLNTIFELTSNPYFTSLISLFELIFILFPILYIRKYLQNPTIKNRFILLGFTSRGFDRKKLLKEILIGLSLAFVGVLMVALISLFTEEIIEYLFSIEIIQDIPTGFLPTDISSLIVLSLIMILIIGTSEEILFRGFMQKGLERSLGSKMGILLTAFLFSMIHVIGILFIDLNSPLVILISFLLSFFPYFSISILLGLIYHWRKENLIAVVITHGVYDTLTIVLAFFLYGIF
ncbi:hypothetical protein LCGC14_1012330 [marine sediment metagenome]|uniref:CAAX prenyl protease 2/Lysostaphin resistance protein A-like domain-containing protein n=1 Tax=marine sediment metagenome TaxID=412755 RepID=A0A0F9R610_9ZZZZ